MDREYIQVTQTSASLDPDSIKNSLKSLHKLTGDRPNGLVRRVSPFHNDEAVTFEFIATSEGANEPVEFYYGADDGLEILQQRLVTIFPSSFDIERVEVDFAEKFGQQAETRELGVDESLQGVKWHGSVDRRKDWMTTLSGFSQNREPTVATESDDARHSGRSPLAPLIDQMTRSEHPMVYQVLFTRKRDWTKQARRRSGALLAGTDTLLQKILALETPGPRTNSAAQAAGFHQRDTQDTIPTKSPQFPTAMRDREREEKSVTRLDQLRENTPKRTFTANVRLLAFPETEDDSETLDAQLNNIRAIFDPLDGQYYEVDGRRIRGTSPLPWLDGKRTEAAYERFCNRSIETRGRVRRPRLTNRSDSRPDLVLNPDELANFTIMPSASGLTVEGDRGAQAEQRSRNPLPRPNHSMTKQLRRPGLDLGYLLNENRDPETDPIRLPADLLPFHVGRFAKTGAGKSVALINDALSLVEQTSGPVFMIDAKGGGLPEEYMRAHGKRFGFEDLENRVIHFDIPEQLPGFAFFNIQPALANGVRRTQAIKDRVDHYVEVLKMTMGEERYEQAVVSPNLLKYLIRLMYDEEHGLDHGRYRESVDYFGQSQLEQVVDRLYDAGPPQSNPDLVPESSSDAVSSKIHRHLTADPRTFANIMGGVSNRMDYVTADPFLKQIFDTTEPRFDMRELLDEDVVVIFDLGNLRTDAAKVMAGVILTNLYDAVTERDQAALGAKPDDYVANLLIDEASSVVVSDVLNDLLEKGREFKLSVELASQFPEQMELEGDREVYLNVLNNIGSPIVGKIAVDDEIARALAHEDMDPVDFRNRVRALPRGEWIAQVPSPTFGETGPMPFSVEPLPIPPGHSECETPLSPEKRTVSRMRWMPFTSGHKPNMAFRSTRVLRRRRSPKDSRNYFSSKRPASTNYWQY